MVTSAFVRWKPAKCQIEVNRTIEDIAGIRINQEIIHQHILDPGAVEAGDLKGAAASVHDGIGEMDLPDGFRTGVWSSQECCGSHRDQFSLSSHDRIEVSGSKEV